MADYMTKFFTSGFIFPGISWNQLLLGIGLGILLGAIWFATYWTPILKKPWAWAVLISSAILAWTAASFVQIPLQLWTGQALNRFWSQEIIIRWLLLTGIPTVLLSGLVQEGAKLIPVVVYWWRNDRSIDPKLGLIIGAVAGLGFGVFEAVWAHNTVFAAGWNWELVQTIGLIALAPFWERFSAVALHIAVSALAGYGLAKGWGWQFYLLASFLHTVMNYSAVLLQKGLFTTVHLEIYSTITAVLITAGVLWLRWKKSENMWESMNGFELT